MDKRHFMRLIDQTKDALKKRGPYTIKEPERDTQKLDVQFGVSG